MRLRKAIGVSMAVTLGLWGFMPTLARTAKDGAAAETGTDFQVNGSTLKMVWIKPGSFEMGGRQGGFDGTPVTTVKITEGFWLGQTEVTQRQWMALMPKNRSYTIGDSLPIEMISWEDAMAFCEKLNTVERAAGRLPAGYIYSLPTEAQWEYACRAGKDPLHDEIARMAWFNGTAKDKIQPVRLKQANNWGLYDMLGNAGEWCLDWHARELPGGNVADPVGPKTGEARVYRGGTVGASDDTCRPAFRWGLSPEQRIESFGFRVALIKQTLVRTK